MMDIQVVGKSSSASAGPVVPSKRKRSRDSKQCYAFKKGNCERGSDCKFRHGTSEDRRESEVLKEQTRVGEGQEERKNMSNGTKKDQGQSGQKKQKKKKHIQEVERVQKHRDDLKDDSVEMEVEEASTESGGREYMTDSLFSELTIAPQVKRALADVLQYQNMTLVQKATLPVIMRGVDCLAKAKTGTGKTLAFLIPSIEHILNNGIKRDKGMRGEKNPISTLILSPTRELAMQIAKEAAQLLHFLPTLRTVCLVGGTNMKKDVRMLNEGSVDILVATPGRLLDHLDNTHGVASRLHQARVVILDEADNLLDMGFKPSIDKIFTFLPPREDRQTLLFSATVPPAVKQVAREVLRPGYKLVDTVGEVVASQTHVHVMQETVTVTMNEVIPAVVSILQREINKGGNYKIIVFFSTARVTGYMSFLFGKLQCPVLDIHSRKSQSSRIKTSERFRDAKKAILFSSDVSARGMDYPDVTFVLQVGLTDKEQYTHRLGRTARAGKGGLGMLLLMDFEERHMLRALEGNYAIKLIRCFELAKANRMSTINQTGVPLERSSKASLDLEKYNSICDVAVQRVLQEPEGRKAAEQAYGAWLGFYNGNKKNCGGWNNSQLVEAANEFSVTLGFPEGEPPALEKKTIGKMGLKGVPGLRISHHSR